ncbi:MAG: MATE family efflux transporter [Solobacterium sp.]|nr:MATE family efflux transporter [Solobacterium sp.]MCH4222074.1 MATE family efflux transporter [Solobacterium sp.]MCH4265773.1 MATE family efflux transporter [Solobacterium sp.]
MKRRENTMLTGPIGKELLLFFFPILFGTLFQQLYNTVDAMVVGNFVGTNALAAVGGSTGTFLNLLTGFMIGLSSGATVVVAQFYGNNNRAMVKKTVASGMWLAIVLGSILTVIAFLVSPQLLRLLNVPDEIFADSLIYLRVYLIGLVPTMIYNTGAGVLRAIGDSKRPLYFLIVSCITNIVLDIVLVAVCKFGIVGAAAATVVSQMASCFLTLRLLSHTDDCYEYQLREFSFDPVILKQIVVIGLPSGIQSALYSVANLFVQASVNSFGTSTVAAYTAFGKIDATFWNASGALGQAFMTFAGQNFGAGNVKRVKKGVKHGILIYVVGSALISTACWLLGPYIFRLFTPDTAVIEIGMGILHFICPFWVTFCLVEILSSGIRACGDSVIPTCITAAGIGAFRIAWIVLYPCASVYDALFCYPVSWIITSILFLVYYLQGGWLKRSLARREALMNVHKS